MRSWRQSKIRQCARFCWSCSVETSVVELIGVFQVNCSDPFSLAAELAVQPLVEVHFGIFHRRLVGSGVVESLLVQRAAPLVEAGADLVVLDGGLEAGGP